jgi:hypothetical protein
LIKTFHTPKKFFFSKSCEIPIARALFHSETQEMAPKRTEAQIRAEVERERVRARILELWRTNQYRYQQIGNDPQVMKSKSTVQSIIKTFGARESTSSAWAGGRPTVMKPQYVIRSFPYVFCSLCAFSYRRTLGRLAMKHPKWSARRLIDEIDGYLRQALNDRPPNAVVQVCSFVRSIRSLVRILRCPQSHRCQPLLEHFEQWASSAARWSKNQFWIL